MENKRIKYSYNGMNRDVSKSLFPNNFYYEGKNIRINSTDSQSTGSIINEKGNSLILEIPIPVIDYNLKTISYNEKVLNYTTDEINYTSQSSEQVIIGHSNSRELLILFTTDNNGFDCIWSVNYETYDLNLLYLRNLNFSINNPIQTINNFENENIDKVYWVDGVNQMRFINIKHSIDNQDLQGLIDVSQDIINMVGKYNLSQPLITDVLSGGNHTSGMIQYAYNLYNINSSQTKISPLSILIPLDKNNLGGGAINEVVGALPVISISDIDENYTNIKVYSIKYTSLNQTPVISIIDDREIPSSRDIEIFDDGLSIQTISIEEFIFLGSDILIPKHINTKFNRLFFANYKEINFNVDLDCRAYSFNNLGTSTIYDNLVLSGGIPSGTPFTIVNDNDYDNPILNKFDSVNLNYDVYKYQKDGITFGGEGKYIKYQLTQNLIYNPDNKYFKDEEIYRFGIEFFNIFGQFSQPIWISDFKALNGNLEGKYNTLKVTLKPEFFTWLNTNIFDTEYDKPVGYKIVVAERTINDRTIIANGILGTMMINDKSTRDITHPPTPTEVTYLRSKADDLPKLPNFLLRNTNETSLYGITQPLKRSLHLDDMNTLRNSPNTEIQRAYYGDRDTSGRFYQYNSMLQLYSPEILFGDSITSSTSTQLRIKGALKNTYNTVWARKYNTVPELHDEFKALNGLSPHYATTVNTLSGSAYLPLNNGLIGHPRESDPHRFVQSMFYRTYGNITNDDDYSLNNSIVTFTNTLNITTGTEPDPDNELIKYISGNKGIQVNLNTLYFESIITYNINPTLPYSSTNYNIKICGDSEGNNVLQSLIGVNGNQTISFSNNLNVGETDRIDQYFLSIESINDFTVDIDCEIELGDSLTSDYLVKETLNNNFIVNNIIPSGNSFIPSTTINKIDIYGSPEITEKGQSFTAYNGNAKYRYTNSLESFYSDGYTDYADDGTFNRKIVSVNSYGNRCVTFVTGSDNPLVEHWNRPLIEQLLSSSGLTGDDNGLIGELVKTDNEIYLGNIYGGNSYEDKQRSNYLEVGIYQKLNPLTPEILINSPGDTFVHSFRFARIVRTDLDIKQEGTYTLEEIVEFTTESSIDLKNRNDLSLNAWDSKFQPLDSEYHKYNTVYSQTPNLITRRNLNYNTKRLNNFDTNIIASKLKSAGELIDSWSDLQINEVLTLDGKHGSINSLISFNDELYTIQDKAFAFISVSPRVQVQGADGLQIQLGSGSVLDRYQYVSTDSGTLNKWSVVSTSQGVYYYDLLNKSFMVFRNQINGLSDLKNMHSYFTTKTELSELKTDNPLLKQGISSGFDHVNNDVFMTFHKNEESFTISFNEMRQQFISFYDYLPSIYMSRGQFFITTNPELNSIYRQYDGEYNKFYEQYYPSYIILNLNPESDLDTVFDNIMFKSEIYLNDVDQPDKTLTSLRLYHEYQDSGIIPLIVGRNSNIRRRFRDWNALLPRNENSRERIRNPWVHLLLQLDNTSNYKMILHDIVLSYSI